jgi:HPr kinase/phosphorylase
MQIHATCVARDGQGVLLLGPSGAGKSDLALRLIERGFVLVADDRVELTGAIASPPQDLAGLIEVRGVGVVRMCHEAPVPVVLALELRPAPERLPSVARDPLSGAPILTLDPAPPSAPAKVMIALDCVLGRISCVAGALEPDDYCADDQKPVS